jgi:hypothetical protein
VGLQAINQEADKADKAEAEELAEAVVRVVLSSGVVRGDSPAVVPTVAIASLSEFTGVTFSTK